MVICAGHNHAPPQRGLDGHLLAPQPAHGGPAGSHHPRLAAQQPIHQTFNRQPRLFWPWTGEVWWPISTSQFGDQARTPAALAARAQPLRRERHARLTIRPVIPAGVTWMNTVLIPGAQGRIWSIGHSPITCCGAAPAWACQCTTTLQPVRDRWSRSSTSSATAQGWTSSDKIPLGGRSKVGKSIVEDVVDRQDLRTVSRLPSYPADIA